MSARTLHYARARDGTNIAYLTLGEGPDLVFASNIFGDVHHYFLPHPHTRRMTDELVGRGWRVTRYDLRGMGSSDREVEDMSLQARLLDLEAVVSRLGLDRFYLAGLDGGAAVAAHYAAEHAAQVAALVLLNPYISGRRQFEANPGLQVLAGLEGVAQDQWDIAALTAGNVVTGFENSSHARELAEGFRRAATPKTWSAYARSTRLVDLTDVLPRIAAPTLVVHDAGFPFGSFAFCQQVAARLPDARLVVVDGDPATEIAEIDEFLKSVGATSPSTRPSSASDEPVPAPHLSRRQAEVLELMARGKTNKEIAEALVLSIRTVERHVAGIYARLGVRNRTEAVAYALTRLPLRGL
jgi:pimeloyl-ACP methyl ester carboxylesterase/DNA-binding CsgD family transcriptional regulator